MQVQKKEIKEKIKESALGEFYRRGYKGASIRSIAQIAGITPGNIYAYFKSKDDLLLSVMNDTIESINNYIAYLSKNEACSGDTLRYVADEITDLFLNHKRQFMILMSGFPSDKLGNFYGSLNNAITRRINEDYLSALGLDDIVLAGAISEGYVSGLMNIFNNYGNNECDLKRLVKDFTQIMFSTDSLTGGTEKKWQLS